MMEGKGWKRLKGKDGKEGMNMKRRKKVERKRWSKTLEMKGLKGKQERN